MTKHFANPMYCPGTFFWDTANGVRLTSHSAISLYSKASLSDDASHLPSDFEHFDLIMQSRMCDELPEGVCVGDESANRSIGKKPLKKFLKTLAVIALAKVKGEDIYVSDVEAERRAVICASCTCNQPIQCAGCAGLIVLADKYLNGRITKHNDDLGGCTKCLCYLRAKVFVPLDLLNKIHPEVKFPEKCWVNNGPTNRT